MTYRVILLPEAKEELREGLRGTTSKKRGFGRRFSAAVQDVLRGLRLFPKRHQEAIKDVRLAPVQTFPYVIYYRVIPKQVLVLSIFFGERDPVEWQARV